jgi:hypothetical protein
VQARLHLPADLDQVGLDRARPVGGMPRTTGWTSGRSATSEPAGGRCAWLMTLEVREGMVIGLASGLQAV